MLTCPELSLKVLVERIRGYFRSKTLKNKFILDECFHALEFTLDVSLLAFLSGVGDQLQICCILMQLWTKAGICGKVHFKSLAF